MTGREELLLKMYDQLFNDINRHIMVVWQSVGVLVSAFAAFSLTEHEVLTLDLTASIILLLCAWLMAHLLDAGYWYNRNLVIIANIERQFLIESDLNDIHFYFGAHRPNNKIIQHLRLQLILGIGLGAIVLIYHFFERVVPGFCAPLSNFEMLRALPYLLVIISTILLLVMKEDLLNKYNEFLRNSPGKAINDSNVNYAFGHAHGKTGLPFFIETLKNLVSKQ